MKKTLTILLSAVVVIALLFAYALPASAAEVTVGEAGWVPNPALRTPSSYYYRTLVNYYGTNIKGTCSHVALASLLTFYDAHHNDRFVPESMDYPANDLNYGAPGTMYEGDESEIAFSDAGYVSYVNEFAPYSVHLYLISMALGMGMYGNNTPESYGLYEDQIYDLIVNYLDVTGGFTEDFSGSIVQMEFAGSGEESQQEMVNLIRDLLVEGKAVMCLNYRNSYDSNEHLSFNGEDGHCIIAYDCQVPSNPNKGNILVHTGYHNTTPGGAWARDTMAASGFSYIYAILWFDTSDVPHYCSDNYVGMCGCDFFEYASP